MTALLLPALVLGLMWQNALPPQIQAILRTSYRSYAPVQPARDLQEFFRVNYPTERTWLARGDFDGDGGQDVALLLESGQQGRKRKIVLAFLRRGDSYQPVYAGRGHDFIQTIKKGETGYDFETESHFYYERDSIYTETFERAGDSLTWVNGNFVSRPTSD